MDASAKIPQLGTAHAYLEHWAKNTPDKVALVQHETGLETTYAQLNELVDLYTLALIKLGVAGGDRVAVMGQQSAQCLAVQYACFKMGAIICPIDVKLKPHEAVRNLDKIRPVVFIMLGDSYCKNFYSVNAAVTEKCPYIRHIFFHSLDGTGEAAPGTRDADILFDLNNLLSLRDDGDLARKRNKVCHDVSERNDALIIFTTGTTGEPKPALLGHKCIVAQMNIFMRATTMPPQEMIRLCILPCSHVGGTTMTVYTTIMGGGTNVLLYQFHPVSALKAVEVRRANFIGAVPTMYRMMWSVPDYDKFDLSSLDCVYYAGSMGDIDFLNRLARMAPHFGTCLGMTECGGAGTYTPMPISVETLHGQVGSADESVAEISIREPMLPDGRAGAEKAFGDEGEICYHPPLVFSGYFGMPEEKIVSSEGILYSGDMGYFKDTGGRKAVYYLARKKFIIKSKGYNVFPDEVSAYIMRYPGVSLAEVLGVRHSTFDEGVLAFVLPEPGASLDADDLMRHCKGLVAYKRPSYIKIWDEGVFPMTNNGKPDKKVLAAKAEEIVSLLRGRGLWD
ncbi:MAG: acyl--CoA ligase [Deltaproteobacteria bacterium]|jgi:acyl-CoA synthetase (AMP-forming)/AMP-acid ligase II|nr:acyl--CoA ligase [Deltaproteobacteria bacterium]